MRPLSDAPPPPIAQFRQLVEDFFVEELPAYAPVGAGEHLFITIRKRDLTTLEALRRICQALDLDSRSAGFAGMKDRRAVAIQTLSVPYPTKRDVAEAKSLSLPGIDVLDAIRHGNKLKPGHLVGNRFRIVLRGLEPAALTSVGEQIEQLGVSGAPNEFGPQRFGRDGTNPERALAWLAGKTSGPRDRREQRLLFSSVQAWLFNQSLAARVAAGTWDRPLEGDLLKKADTGGLFICTDLAVDTERARAGEVSPTGPMFGAKMRWPEGEPARIELKILESALGMKELLERHHRLGEGTRRPLRLPVTDTRFYPHAEDRSALVVEFVLPKGGYATTVLSQVVTLGEPSRGAEDVSTFEDVSG